MGGLKSRGRAFALQQLYQLEIHQTPLNANLQGRWPDLAPEGKVLDFTTRLVEATRAHQPQIDAHLRKNLAHWKLERLSVVVRNLLRLALCEMLVLGDTPFEVVIDEAVGLARGFAEDDAHKFVNAVLEKCWVSAPSASLSRTHRVKTILSKTVE